MTKTLMDLAESRQIREMMCHWDGLSELFLQNWRESSGVLLPALLDQIRVCSLIPGAYYDCEAPACSWDSADSVW